eukprot:CAMPEP_0182450600 /NCGR_PEP_ID=MMETSP1172-20130603/42386_1 /TAXON_ID=708627 /ORGANISM="Timspurckia oligopyrenoides, Strain CCMP3278" /LENGTH=533 /DNA_ID=CAMNT_0024648267 /DNA_START=128 /DNA_END=1732 /DNA_ORIENTATION=+
MNSISFIGSSMIHVSSLTHQSKLSWNPSGFKNLTVCENSLTFFRKRSRSCSRLSPLCSSSENSSKGSQKPSEHKVLLKHLDSNHKNNTNHGADSVSSSLNNGERMFSNLQRTSEGFRHSPGSVIGMTALIAGTTIGAGCLAIPAVSYSTGFLPSSTALFLAWLYMLSAGLLLAEASLYTMCTLGRSGVSILSMVEITLGAPGARLASGAYLFLHYAMLVAYISQGGSVLAEQVLHIPSAAGAFVFCALGGGLLYALPRKTIEDANVALVGAVLVCFFSVVALTGRSMDINALTSNPHWELMAKMAPTALTSMVYHNIIPVVCSSLEGDIGKIRTSVAIGSLIPLLMFVSLDGAVLGSVSQFMNESNAVISGSFQDPLDIIMKGDNVLISNFVGAFSELAILTSFIGFVFGLTEFFADVFQSKKPSISQNQSLLFGCTLIPPLGIALAAPDLFFAALDSAGTYGITLLFGILPAAMVWKIRAERADWMQAESSSNTNRNSNEFSIPQLVPGGNAVLAAVIASAVALIAYSTFTP